MKQQATLPVTVNYHLNKNCNFRCKGCYATFNDDPTVRGAMLPRDEMFRIVEQVAAAPLPEGKAARKLTFAGGEPTLCPWLPALVSHANSLGLVTMVVTNGSRCDAAYLERMSAVLDWLTVSIDSLDPETNRQIGRHDARGVPLSALRYAEILSQASALGIRTKVNTVVNRLNSGEDMNAFILGSGIDRWKILQVMGVAGQNDSHFEALSISRGTFDAFVKRHDAVIDSGIRLIAEPVDMIRGSYCMIDPQGRFFDSDSGSHRYSAPILEVGIESAFASVAFDRERFDARGGSYDFGAPRTSDYPRMSGSVRAAY